MDKLEALNVNRPLAAVTVGYAAGIVLGWVLLDRPYLVLWLLGFILLMAAGAVFRRLVSLFMAVLLLIACAAGATSFQVAARVSSGEILTYSGNPVFVEGTVVEEPLPVEDSISYQVQVEAVETGQGRFPVSGKLLVKVYGTEQQRYWFGERLRLRGVIDEPRGRRNPGGFDYRFYLCTQGISGVMHVKPYQVSSLGCGEVSRLADSALALRAQLVQGIEAGLPSPCAELLSAILFGQRHLLPEAVQESFKKSGVAHLLAVSGLHVGLVAALILGFCRRVRIKGRLPLAAAVLIIFGYAYVTGMRPPALRAAVMFSIGSGAVLLDRENDLSTAISIAALLTLVLNPLHLFTAGFQLSYAATLAIIYGAPPLMDLFKRCKLPSFIRSLLAVTLAAQLGVLPVSAAHFQHIPLGALWFNLLLLPVMPPVVGLGLAAALLQLVSPVLAWPLFPGVRLLLEYILAVTGIAGFAGFYIPIYTPSILIWAFYYTALGLILVCYYRKQDARAKLPPEYNLAPPADIGQSPYDAGAAGISGMPGLFSGLALYRRLRPFYLLLAGLALAAAIMWGSLLLPAPSQQRLTVTFIDVGQGASALVESGRGRILIDCGGKMQFAGDPGEIGEQVLLPFLRYRGVRSLDLVIITHPHEDHFGGLKPLLESIPVKSIWISPQPGSSPYYGEMLEQASSLGIPVTKVQAGQRWVGFGIILEVLGPPQPLHTATGSDENNNSIVLRLLHPRAKLLFCGDIEQAALQDLLRRQPSNLNAGVLLVPHHGGLLPDLPRLIRAARPRVAVIPVGGNPFGHPHPSTLEALQQAGVLTLRSDIHGAVIMNIDNRGLAVETMSGFKQASSGW
ncbi:MAG TPA: ComEC/Rec2 family competence protein [Firmicutes bacterium]|nr:ComEC/Rec2 family competence protein [Bacillota bacterium]